MSYTARITEISENLNTVKNSQGWITALDHFKRLCGNPIIGEAYYFEIDSSNTIISISLLSQDGQTI